MTPDQFKALKHGNVISDSHGHPHVVLHTLRDPKTGELEYAGLIPAIGLKEAKKYTLVSDQTSETLLIAPDGTEVGKLTGKTK